MTLNIDNIDGQASKTVIRRSGHRAVKRRKLDQIDVDDTTHLEALATDYPKIWLMIEHNVIMNSAVTQMRFRISLIEEACGYSAS